MKNSLTIKMTLLTLAAFLLTSTLSLAQPGPKSGGSHGAPPSMHHSSPSHGPSAPPSARPAPSRAPSSARPAPSRPPVAPPSARPTPSRPPVAPPSVRPTSSRPPVAPPSARPTPSRPPVPPPSVRPSGPKPVPGPSHHVTPGPKPGPVPGPSHHVTPGPKPGPVPGPSHHVTPGPKPGPVPGPSHHVTPGPKPGPGPSHYPGHSYIPPAPRPSWQTRPHDHFDPIYSSVRRAMYGPHFTPPPPAPRPYWNNWGLSVALGWTNFAISTGAFTLGWWDNMYYAAPWWNYYYYRGAYPDYYWWGRPTWNQVRTFYPAYNWTDGYYYDYGQNVVIGDDSYVYINNQKISTQYEYAQSAAELASYNMPSAQIPSSAYQRNLQWLPLGTFALSTSPVHPERTTKAAIQLAATNDGLISGSFYNRDANKTFPIQGRVDPQTQRVAFYVIGAEDTVFETGMYNLTQAQTPIMIHKNGGRVTQNCLLVRLTPPEQSVSTTPNVPVVQGSAEYALPIEDDANDAQTFVHSIVE